MQDSQGSFTIKNWSEGDRPREKLLYKGKNSLSDAELIAILIGSGNQNESAVALSQRILAAVKNNLNQLAKMSVVDLIKFKGIGKAKAVTIVAALELGKRKRTEAALVTPNITSSKTVFELMLPIFEDLKHEEFWVLYLNNANKLLLKTQLSKGGLTATVVDIRLIMQKALALAAVGIILLHNHPSGALRPSRHDIQITQKLKTAAQSLDIKVLDHIIVTQNDYFSFADQNML